MRRYGLYDATRGLMTALAVGLAGLLLWVATQVGVQSTARFWAAMGIVAAGGLVLALLPALGGWTSGLRLRISPGALLLGVLPALVVTGWILLATQPGNGWQEGRFVSWSHDLGLMGIVHAVGLWHGALAFGFGVVLGMSLDALPVVERVDEVVPERTVVEQPVAAADEPLTQERDAVPAVPAERRDRVTTGE
jgi:hypothetical protein